MSLLMFILVLPNMESWFIFYYMPKLARLIVFQLSLNDSRHTINQNNGKSKVLHADVTSNLTSNYFES